MSTCLILLTTCGKMYYLINKNRILLSMTHFLRKVRQSQADICMALDPERKYSPLMSFSAISDTQQKLQLTVELAPFILLQLKWKDPMMGYEDLASNFLLS